MPRSKFVEPSIGSSTQVSGPSPVHARLLGQHPEAAGDEHARARRVGDDVGVVLRRAPPERPAALAADDRVADGAAAASREEPEHLLVPHRASVPSVSSQDPR